MPPSRNCSWLRKGNIITDELLSDIEKCTRPVAVTASDLPLYFEQNCKFATIMLRPATAAQGNLLQKYRLGRPECRLHNQMCGISSFLHGCPPT